MKPSIDTVIVEQLAQAQISDPAYHALLKALVATPCGLAVDSGRGAVASNRAGFRGCYDSRRSTHHQGLWSKAHCGLAAVSMGSKYSGLSSVGKAKSVTVSGS